MPADPGIHVAPPGHFEPRLDHVPRVDDPRVLARLNQIDGDAADPGVLEDDIGDPVRIDHERRGRPAARRPEGHPLDRKGPHVERRGAVGGRHAVPTSVGRSTAVLNALSACSTILRRSARSASGGSAGSPQTCSILTPWTTRFAPACIASGGSALITATGIPTRSISLLIVAPQRLQDPQAATRSAPFTPAARSAAAISRPLRLQSTRR